MALEHTIIPIFYSSILAQYLSKGWVVAISIHGIVLLL
jgi:hypothetical protein